MRSSENDTRRPQSRDYFTKMYRKKNLLLQVNAFSLPGMLLTVDNVMNLATLSSTSGSAKQHSLRAYLLIQQCRGNELDCTHAVGLRDASRMLYVFLWVQKTHLPPLPPKNVCGTCLGETCTNVTVFWWLGLELQWKSTQPCDWQPKNSHICMGYIGETGLVRQSSNHSSLSFTHTTYSPLKYLLVPEQHYIKFN